METKKRFSELKPKQTFAYKGIVYIKTANGRAIEFEHKGISSRYYFIHPNAMCLTMRYVTPPTEYTPPSENRMILHPISTSGTYVYPPKSNKLNEGLKMILRYIFCLSFAFFIVMFLSVDPLKPHLISFLKNIININIIAVVLCLFKYIYPKLRD